MKNTEKEMIKARIADLIKQGIDRELAKFMAKAEFKNGLLISSDGTVIY